MSDRALELSVCITGVCALVGFLALAELPRIFDWWERRSKKRPGFVDLTGWRR